MKLVFTDPPIVLTPKTVKAICALPNLETRSYTTFAIDEAELAERDAAQLARARTQAVERINRRVGDLRKRIYTDISYLTADPSITADMDQLFGHLASQSRLPKMKRLLVAPFQLHADMQQRIAAVGDAAARGAVGRIVIKMNALTDVPLIEALLQAGQKGARIVASLAHRPSGRPSTVSGPPWRHQSSSVVSGRCHEPSSVGITSGKGADCRRSFGCGCQRITSSEHPGTRGSLTATAPLSSCAEPVIVNDGMYQSSTPYAPLRATQVSRGSATLYAPHPTNAFEAMVRATPSHASTA